MINDRNTRKKDPLGIVQEPPKRPKQDPLGLFKNPSEVKTPVEDAAMESAKARLDELDNTPIKFVSPQDDSGQPPKTPLLQESEESLGLNGDTPFPMLPNSMFNTAPAMSTGVEQTDVGREINIQNAKERITKMVAGFNENPGEIQRNITAVIANQYEEVIGKAEEEGDTKYAARLKDELSEVRQFHNFLVEEGAEEYNDKYGFTERTLLKLKKGVLGRMLSSNGKALADNKVLNIYEAIDQTGKIPRLSDSRSLSQFSGAGFFPMAQEYLNASPQERQQLKAVELERFAKDVADIREIRKNIEALPTNPKAEKFLTATSFGEAFDAFLDAPLEVTSEVAFANLPQMSEVLLAGAAGGFIGGPYGAGVAAGAKSAGLEYGNLILEELARAGVDLDKDEDVLAAVRNKELMEKVKKNARAGSAIVGAFDGAATLLAASRFIPKGTVDDIAEFIGREAFDEAIQVTGQGGLGGAGAALSELQRAGEITDFGEISAEIVGEGAFAPLRAFGIRNSVRLMEVNRARHSVNEYIVFDELLNGIHAQRTQAVNLGRASDVRRADQLAADIRERRQKMVDDQRDRLVDHRDRLEQRVRDIERKKGAKAFARPDFKAMLAELDAVNKMLAGEQVLIEEQTQQTTEEQDDATRTTTPVQDESTQETQETQEEGTPPEPEISDDTTGEPGEPGTDVVEDEATREEPDIPLRKRLEGVEKEIERFEALEDPTRDDNDYLTYLRDEQERLQTRIRSNEEARQREDSPIPPAQQQVGVSDQATIEAADSHVGQKISFTPAGASPNQASTPVQRVLRKDGGGFYVEYQGSKNYLKMNLAEEEGGASSLVYRSGVFVPKDETFSIDQVDPDLLQASQELEGKGMNQASDQVLQNATGAPPQEHTATQLDENTYNYRDFVLTKTSAGDFNILQSGKKLDTTGSLQDAKNKVDAIVSGQANTATGQTLGEAIPSQSLRGAELPKSGVSPANRANGVVYVGGLLDNHGTIAEAHSLNPEQVQIESGFVTPDGRYLTREETVEYVNNEGVQYKKTGEGTPQNQFYSEQIIPEKKKPTSTVVPKNYKQDTNVRSQEKRSVIASLKRNPDEYGNGNKIVSKEEADKARAELIKAAGQLNMGIDPKVLKLSAKLATFHIEAGVRSFNDFAKVMINEIGEQVIPRLRELYHSAIKRAGLNEQAFSDKPEIDRFFLEYYKNQYEEVFSVEDAKTLTSKTTQYADKETKSQLQHQALTELAKAYHNDSSNEITSVIDFINQVNKDFPGQFNRAQLRASWAAARSNAENTRRFWFDQSLSERTGIPLHVVSFYHDVGTIMRKKLQDSFIGQKKVQEQIKKLRGEDYFNQNERLDAYLQEELLRGRVSELQWETTNMENPNSSIRKILQIAKENNLDIGQWKNYYAGLRRADRLRAVGLNDLAEKVANEAFQADPNTNDDVQRYLHAKHAKEANDHLVSQIESRIQGLELQLEQIPDTPDNKQQRASIKGQITRLKNQIPNAQRGSGLTNKDAQDILDRLEEQGKTGALQEIADIVYDINNRMLEMRKENGLNSDEQIEEFQSRFQNYVPLNRVLFDPFGNLMEQVGKSTTAGQNNAPGTSFKQRKGSDRPVDNILGTVMMNFDHLIGDIERNNIMVSLAELYDSEWAMGNEMFGRSVRANTAEDVKIAEKIPYRIKNSDGSVEDRVLIFNAGSKMVYDAMSEFDGNHSDTFLKGAVNTLRSFMNYLRFVRTSASVNFIFSNPQRDIGTVMGNMSSDFGYGASLKFAKDIFYTKSRFVDAQRSIWEFLRDEDTPGSREYQELKQLGGTTGFYQLSDRADILKKMRRIEKELNSRVLQSGQPVRNTAKYAKNTFKGVIKGIEMVNEIAENATRLTAYRTALENGYTKKQAASYALNVNTNFNKSGDWGDLFKIGFQFANSAIQGHTRMARAAKVDPQRFTQTALSLMAMGAANASFNDWMNKEAHDRLKRTRPWLFNNNLVFLGPEGDVMFKIYLPFGYNVFKAAGDIVYDVSNESVDGETAVARLGDAVADSFNPFRGSEMFTGGVQGLLLAATPTALEPATEIAVNKSFFGNIYPPFKEALQESIGLQDFQLKYDSVNPYMEYVTNFLAKHGVADISPETIEHMTYFLGGSVGREWINLMSKSLNTDQAQREGLTLYTRSDGSEVKILPNNVPVMSRFLNTVDKDKLAASSLYQTVGDLSTESFDVNGEDFEKVLNSLGSDFEVLLENDLLPEGDNETMQKTINAFVKTVFRNNMRDQTVQHFKEQGLTGEENAEARREYYDRINRRVRTFRIPQLDRIDRANFRSLPFGTRRSKIISDTVIEQIEVKVN